MQKLQEVIEALAKQSAAISKSQPGLTMEELSRYEEYRGFLNKRTVKLGIETFLAAIPARYKEKVCLIANPLYEQGGMWGAFLELLTIANIEQVCFIVHKLGPKNTIGETLPSIGDTEKPKIHLGLIGEESGCGHYSLLIPNEHAAQMLEITTVLSQKKKEEALRDMVLRPVDVKLAPPDLRIADNWERVQKEIAELEEKIKQMAEASKIIPVVSPIIAVDVKVPVEKAECSTLASLALSSAKAFLPIEVPAFTIKHISAFGDCLFDAAIQGIKLLRQPEILPTDSIPEEIIALRKSVAAAMDEERIASSFRDYILNKTVGAAIDARLRLPNSDLLAEARIWRYRLSIAIHASNRLRNAAKVGDCITIQQLIDRGVDVNTQVDHYDLVKDNSLNTALHEAILALIAIPLEETDKILAINQAIKLLRG